MTIDKQSNNNAEAVYNAYWDSYLAGDIKTMANFIDDGFKVIGSTESELFQNKKEVIKFYSDTADQISGKVKLKNRNINRTNFGNLILFSEVSDIYIYDDKDWSFYSKIRLTSLMKEKADGWKFINQHGSVPDAKTEEGEQLAFEKIQKQNIELREAVKRRTVELELKNRELEIEASLERIRTTAMSMQNSDELLDVVEIINMELNSLGIPDIRNTNINIFNDAKEMFLNYEYSEYDGKAFNKVSYNSHPSNTQYVNRMKENPKDHMITEFTGQELEEWKKWRIEEGQKPDQKLEQAGSLYYYDYSIGSGSIGVSSFGPIDNDQIEILKKIRNVFELAYRRYSDIIESEEHAREAKIEASLERVRAKAMAMHNSEDLSSTVGIFFKELKSLGIIPIRCGVGQVDEATRTTNLTTTTSSQIGDSFDVIGKVKQSGHPVLDGIFDHWKSQKEYYPMLEGDDIKAYYGIMNRQINYPEYREDITQYGNMFYFKEGFIFAWTEKRLADEELKIFRRFTSVLSLTYRRYLDLKEAEAQAREAKIENALERVRAKAMAMNNPDDLTQTAHAFFSELVKLNIRTHRCGFGIVDKESQSTDVHATTATLDKSFKIVSGRLNLYGHPILENIFDGYVKQKEYHPVLRGDEISEYYKVMNPQIEFPEFSDDEVQFGYYFYFKEGGVFAWTDKEFSENELEIFRRYTSVLSLTYRRYIDLKEAEAQAREAQIEAALEKIRNHTMGMQKSEELPEVANRMFSEIKSLGIPVWSTAFNTYYKDKKNVICNVSSEGVMQPAFILPLTEENSFKEWYNTVKTKKSFLVQELAGKDLEQHYEYLFTLPGVKDAAKPLEEKGISLPDYQINHICTFDHGFLLFITYEKVPDAHPIFHRFTSVFEQTYTRFLDLENAERQNKIIQAENERKSQELEEARELQLAMLPTKIPKLKDYELAVFMKTATEVGGDYYDFSFKHDGSINIAIGDATGHGMKAGTMVTMIKSLFTANSSTEKITEFFSSSNEAIKNSNLKRMMIAFAMVNIYGKRLEVINAGMPLVHYYRSNENEIYELGGNNMPLGGMHNVKYKADKVEMNNGDVILMLSDGLPELLNAQEKMYGFERIKDELKSVADSNPKKIIDHLTLSAENWQNGRDADDDITFVVIKVK